MDEDLLTEIGQALLRTIEAAVATDDMLALLCISLAQTSRGPASELAESLKRIREAEALERTPSYVALSLRIEQALIRDSEMAILSLRKTTPLPMNPEELRNQLRVIRGGHS